jgi:hypothetical protein
MPSGALGRVPRPPIKEVSVRAILSRGAAFLVLISAGLVVLGCGSSSDDNAPTKAAFIKQADAICKKGNQDINTQAHEFFKKEKIARNEQLNKQQASQLASEIILPNVQKQVDGVDGLTPPKGDEATVQAVTDAANEAIDKSKQDPVALLSNKSGPFAKANKLAKDYGLKVCGN